MDKEMLIIEEKELNAEQLYKIREHVKQYECTPDKKAFLKDVCAYEQKLILLESKNPFDVLMYLDELNLESTQIVLDNLTSEEIKDIVLLFNKEEKEKFYEKFSSSSFVNKFLLHDKYAEEYVDELSFERKLELMDSSNMETIEATEILYESIPENKRTEVAKSLTNIEAAQALNVTEKLVETQEQDINKEKIESKEKGNKESKNIKEEVQENKEENKEENKKEIKQELNVQELEALRNDYFIENIEKYKNHEKFKDIDFKGISSCLMLPLELLEIINRDFEAVQKLKREKEENKEKTSEENKELAQNLEMQSEENELNKENLDSLGDHTEEIANLNSEMQETLSNDKILEDFNVAKRVTELEQIEQIVETINLDKSNIKTR